MGRNRGVPSNIVTQIVVLIVCTAVFGASTYAGSKKGIQTLSNINLWLALLLLTFVFVAKVSQRDKLERPARYVARPPVATEGLSLTQAGNVRYALKTPSVEKHKKGSEPNLGSDPFGFCALHRRIGQNTAF